MIFGMNVKSLGTATPEDFAAHKERLIDRALDIARGGNGRLEGRGGPASDLGPNPP
jgi:hypothetical protein